MITPRLQLQFRRLATAVTLGVCALSAHAQVPLLHYTLDGTLEDSGSLGIDGALAGSAGFTSDNSGVGIFKEALSTDDGTNDYFYANTPAALNQSLNSLTIALWVNVESASDNIDRLVSNANDSTGFDYTISKFMPGTGPGGTDRFDVSFGINSVGDRKTSTDARYQAGKWLFLAVTYDGANVRFYVGDEQTSLDLVSTDTLTGSIAASALNVEIGGSPATGKDRTPVALFNDVRIYDGALSLSELEAIRATAVIPEPSNYAAMLGVFSVGLLAMRGMRSRR